MNLKNNSLGSATAIQPKASLGLLDKRLIFQEEWTIAAPGYPIIHMIVALFIMKILLSHVEYS